MDSRLIIFVILMLGVVNFSFRFIPAVLLNRFSLPKLVEDWLSYIPVATMAAIVVPTLLSGNGHPVFLSVHNLNLLSAVPTIAVAWKTKSLGYSLAIGMITMAILQQVMP